MDIDRTKIEFWVGGVHVGEMGCSTTCDSPPTLKGGTFEERGTRASRPIDGPGTLPLAKIEPPIIAQMLALSRIRSAASKRPLNHDEFDLDIVTSRPE